MRIAVVGIGSPFGMDRLGWAVIEQLMNGRESWGSSSHSLSFSLCGHPALDLLDQIADRDAAIVVDAMQAGGEVGEVLRVAWSEDLKWHASQWSSHGVSLTEVLALGQVLHRLPDRILLVGMEVGMETWREPSGDEVERLAASVRETIHSLLDGC